jgi:flagellar biosynthetic protein FlhB
VPELVASQQDFQHDSLRIALQLGIVVLPILGMFLLGGILSSVLQVGFLWIPDKLAPDVSRLNPLSGLQRIFSVTGAMRLGFGLLKVLLVGIVATCVVWMRWDEVLRAGALDTPEFGKFLIDISLDTVLWAAVALVVLAVLDYAAQRWKYEQDLRMTHQEVREEMRNMQGDPQIAARRRAIQRQMVLNRISSSVPKADVIVTNPTELAVAIQYLPDEMAAPVEHNIPVVERKPLAQLLYKEVDIGKPIPTDAYAAVAEVLAYVYQLKGKKMPAPPKAA